MNELIKQKLQTLPDLPGSYQMLDQFGHIIYVGKAKNLKNRVRSYFVGSHDQKTQNLVSNIEDFTYLVTSSELEAFLLELSLIKQHAPKYNIMLMDDKSYPYIEVTNELYPKLIITRKPNKKALLQYGPFPDVSSARDTVQLLDRIFPLRKCQTLPKKVCLYYHMGQCLGPCEYEVSKEDYQDVIRQIKDFMSGNSKDIIDDLKMKMMKYSDELAFEKAKEMKDILESIDKTVKKQQVIFKDMKNRDIITYHSYDDYISICTLFMRQGKIIFSENHIFNRAESIEDAFVSYVGQYYQRRVIPKELLLPKGIDYSVLERMIDTTILTPQRGDKFALLQMAEENAKIYLQNNIETFLKKHDKTIGAVKELASVLGLEKIRRIDTFDNSNMMGKHPVSAMVVFIDGLPAKKEYRKYLVKTVEKADDYHTMQEVLYRRYQRMLLEQSERPDLIIMDGGITQVHAAKEILHSLYLDIPIIGLKKDDRHHTSVLFNLQEEDVQLDKHSNLFFFLSKIQEEVHRFAITFYRSKHQDQIYASILDAIPEIGKATKQKLLLEFKTIENIKNASEEDLKGLGLNKKQIENIKIALIQK